LLSGIPLVDFLADSTQVFPSKSEAKKMLQGGGVSINKSKLEDINALVNSTHLINDKYIIVQKGKKNYYLIIAE
jgi:tyrosyl-tRNA synthetase